MWTVPAPNWRGLVCLSLVLGAVVYRAPGTLGALAGLVAALGLARAGLPPLVEAGLLVAVNLLGVPCCTRAARCTSCGNSMRR